MLWRLPLADKIEAGGDLEVCGESTQILITLPDNPVLILITLTDNPVLILITRTDNPYR
jgi:hypothetical protein